MSSANNSLGARNLEDLITTHENSYKLFKYQMSLLNKEGKELYIDYLERNLTEAKIEKILEKYFKEHYQGSNIESIVLLKKPFIKLEPLTNEEIHKANEQFLNRKYKNLLAIFNEVNNGIISDKERAVREPIIKNPAYLTFRYRHTDKDRHLNLMGDLYSMLVAKNFIEENKPNGNTVNKFKAIFKGSKEELTYEDKIIWKGSNYQLKHLVTMLITNEIVQFEYHNRWLITSNCFRKVVKDKETKKNVTMHIPSDTFAKTTVKGSMMRIRAINTAIKSLMKELGLESQYKEIL